VVTSATRQRTMSLIWGKLTPAYAALAWSYAALRRRPWSYASTPSDLETHARRRSSGKRTQNAAWHGALGRSANQLLQGCHPLSRILTSTRKQENGWVVAWTEWCRMILWTAPFGTFVFRGISDHDNPNPALKKLTISFLALKGKGLLVPCIRRQRFTRILKAPMEKERRWLSSFYKPVPGCQAPRHGAVLKINAFGE